MISFTDDVFNRLNNLKFYKYCKQSLKNLFYFVYAQKIKLIKLRNNKDIKTQYFLLVQKANASNVKCFLKIKYFVNFYTFTLLSKYFKYSK